MLLTKGTRKWDMSPALGQAQHQQGNGGFFSTPPNSTQHTGDSCTPSRAQDPSIPTLGCCVHPSAAHPGLSLQHSSSQPCPFLSYCVHCWQGSNEERATLVLWVSPRPISNCREASCVG